MPVIIESASVIEQQQEDELSLHDSAGNLTLEGRVVEAFMNELDFSGFLDDPELSEFVDGYLSIGTLNESGEIDEDEEADAEADSTVAIEVEEMDGEVAACFLDEDDVYAMFTHWAQSLPETTVEEKLLKETALNIAGIDEDEDDELDEAKKGKKKASGPRHPFERGEFKKIRKGKGGKMKVNRMLGAMLAKGVIKRKNADGSLPKDKDAFPPGKPMGVIGKKYGDYIKYKKKGEKAGVGRWSKYRNSGFAAKRDAVLRRRAKSQAKKDDAATTQAAATPAKPTAKPKVEPKAGRGRGAKKPEAKGGKSGKGGKGATKTVLRPEVNKNAKRREKAREVAAKAKGGKGAKPGRKAVNASNETPAVAGDVTESVSLAKLGMKRLGSLNESK
jgi:hypothetical protein